MMDTTSEKTSSSDVLFQPVVMTTNIAPQNNNADMKLIDFEVSKSVTPPPPTNGVTPHHQLQDDLLIPDIHSNGDGLHSNGHHDVISDNKQVSVQDLLS